MLVDPLLELGGKPEICCEPIARALAAKNECLFRFTETCGRLRQRIKHGFEIEGRAADDLEHVGSGGLLLQRFAQLVEQARIFDGDDCLIGKIRYQLDLLVSERPDFLTKDGDSSDYLLFLEHRNYDEGPNAAQFDGGDSQWIALKIRFLRPHIENMHRLFGPDYAADGHFRACTDWHAPACLDHRGRCVMRGGDAKFLSLAQI